MISNLKLLNVMLCGNDSKDLVPVIVRGNPLPTHFSRRGERKKSQVLQLGQKVLFCNNMKKKHINIIVVLLNAKPKDVLPLCSTSDVGVSLLSPLWYKDCYFSVSSAPKGLHSDGNPSTRKYPI